MIHQTSYIIYAARHYCNLLLPERSDPTRSLYYSIGVKLTPKCHGWLFGWVLKMKRFALSKERKTESDGEADLGVEQAHSFCFFLVLFTTELTSNGCSCTTGTLFSFQSSHSYMNQSLNQRITFQKPKYSGLSCKIYSYCKYCF